MGDITPFQSRATQIVPDRKTQIEKIKKQCSTGTYKVDIECLTSKLLDSGVLDD